MVNGMEAADKDRGNGDDETVNEIVAEESRDNLSPAFDHEAIDTPLMEVVEECGELYTAVFIGRGGLYR